MSVECCYLSSVGSSVLGLKIRPRLTHRPILTTIRTTSGTLRYLSEASMAQLRAMDNPIPEPIEEAISLPELIAA